MTNDKRRRFVVWTAIFAATIALLIVAGVDRGGVETDAERMQRLSLSYACPVCAGQSVAESNAEVAVTIRQQIRTEVQEGASDDEIRDLLIGQYGGEVLLNPPAEGFAALVWILPVVVVVGGSAVLAAAVSGRRPMVEETSEEDKALVAAARKNGFRTKEEGAVQGLTEPVHLDGADVDAAKASENEEVDGEEE